MANSFKQMAKDSTIKRPKLGLFFVLATIH
ncbi:hypothetical protein M2407_000118 [Serratia sp. BIGb0234]|nr:hypothetical protein [Serratia sp. BIGb0234]